MLNKAGLPKDWDTKTIGVSCDILDRMRIPVNSSDRFGRKGDIPYYGANGLQGWIDDYIFDEELVLIAEDGGYFDEFEKRPIAYMIRGKSWVNNHAHVLRARKQIATNHWIFYNLVHKDIQYYIQGGTRSKLNQSELRNIEVPLPSLPEQRRIAEILDTIDEAIQKTEALISKLKAMKQGLLHDLLTRGLDQNGKLRDPKAHLIPFSEVVQVNPTTDLYGLNDKTNVSFIPMSDVSESGQWVIRQARPLKDVRNGYTCFRENDVLFAKITPCMENGKGGHAIGLVNGIGFGTTEFHVLRAGSEIESRYIYYWTMTEGLRRKAEAQMTGSAGQRRVPAEFFDNFKIPLFPHSEQGKIIEILDAHDARIRTEEQYRDKLKLQKKGLMHDLLTGKVRIKV